MKLSDHFKQFLGDISLNPSRIDRIDSAYETWRDILEKDNEIKDKFLDFFLQGSYATQTSIRPQKEGEEFDVDAVLKLDLEDDDMSPKEALDWLVKRMKANESYKDKIKARDRCVRINYAGDFHMDIVLAKASDNNYIYIPSKKEGEWKKTNPEGFITWCKGIHSDQKEQFRNVTKLLRYWRDHKIGKQTAPKSILLTTLIGKSMVGKNSVAESLLETVKNMINDLDSYILDDGAVFVENPSLTEENLARDWDKDKLETFKKKLNSLKNEAQAAFDENNKSESIKKWQIIFDKFPTELNEASGMAARINSGSVLVSTSGLFSPDEGVPSPKHRFFGDERGW
ncbi:nucleotidyltransferase [Paenibacillus favisporus]|uniref:SMODS domain-containing nucleotidyltransferase n=1 Tax=Paenibacillus favisporus TaxID=221028 RepID=UPI002DBA4A6D|nr:nucleotidyltransferase [Paenibacillus favisporus]MEC0174562.1 nucleotidyltransferase [Paenibacillus favisporus]